MKTIYNGKFSGFARAFFLWGASLALGGCAVSSVYRQPGAPTYAPTLPAEVRFFAAEPKGAYRVLAAVAVDTLGNAEDASKEMREKAAALGANAVVELRLTKIDVASGRTGLAGTAVRLGRE